MEKDRIGIDTNFNPEQNHLNLLPFESDTSSPLEQYRLRLNELEHRNYYAQRRAAREDEISQAEDRVFRENRVRAQELARPALVKIFRDVKEMVSNSPCEETGAAVAGENFWYLSKSLPLGEEGKKTHITYLLKDDGSHNPRKAVEVLISIVGIRSIIKLSDNGGQISIPGASREDAREGNNFMDGTMHEVHFYRYIYEQSRAV